MGFNAQITESCEDFWPSPERTCSKLRSEFCFNVVQKFIASAWTDFRWQNAANCDFLYRMNPMASSNLIS